ncbi:FecCD family ABC transporter permease [Thermoproteus tenax]|uniref:ABC-type Fe3+-siderophore transport system, permease component n=1 Tax=Thermoproteus tenax (strain ATCC 35583 / DSM 2078 / JCM 9277 / NBRC 100435 / Kra 1) TaxID=768679 RepID=G4RM10_THETK|nr:iron ABC transporter permease [Thermoproteus tenax]CCC82605.1 ABC-type Fe3+-siderophore transport system, permease component [Thermoproteus tenax Kra 1]
MSPKGIALLSALATPPLFFAFLMTGSVFVPPNKFFDGNYAVIVWYIRLPTAIAAALIGSILSMSGAVMQTLYRNPLLDPYIAGTASGAAFGALLAYALVAAGLSPVYLILYQVPLAFFFATTASITTLAIGRGDVYATVIGGVAVSYLFSAATTIGLSYLSSLMPQIPPVTFWLFGYIDYVGYRIDVVLAAIVALMTVFAIREARRMDLVAISDELAHVRRLRPNTYRALWIAMISLSVSFVVSQVGVIGFVGLMVPHIVKQMLGHSSAREVVPSSAAVGAPVLLASDILARGALGFSVPVTAITSIFSVPVILLVLKNVGRVSDR